nr:MerR family transcriptional regulator [uncultured Ligilactobacillus sp.]
MNSKEISRKSGLPISTIRYYEKIELIPSPLRKSNGYRDYDEDVLFLLRIIKELTYLGFSLREIKELLNFIQIHSNISDNLDYIQDILEQKTKRY